jgi:hypothetical protein
VYGFRAADSKARSAVAELCSQILWQECVVPHIVSSRLTALSPPSRSHELSKAMVPLLGIQITHYIYIHTQTHTQAHTHTLTLYVYTYAQGIYIHTDTLSHSPSLPLSHTNAMLYIQTHALTHINPCVWSVSVWTSWHKILQRVWRPLTTRKCAASHLSWPLVWIS